MANLLDSIPSIIGGATKSIRKAMTLTKTVITTPTDKPWEPATSTDTAYPFEGIVLDYRDSQINGTTILRNDRKVMIFSVTVSGGQSPAEGDKITTEWKTYKVINVSRDPAGATFECQVRSV